MGIIFFIFAHPNSDIGVLLTLLFLLAGLCSKMLQGRWTKVLVSQLCTGRTATSCPTMICSSCWLISES